MRLSLTAALLLSSTMLAGAQDAQKEFPAKLLGRKRCFQATALTCCGA